MCVGGKIGQRFIEVFHKRRNVERLIELIEELKGK